MFMHRDPARLRHRAIEFAGMVGEASVEIGKVGLGSPDASDVRKDGSSHAQTPIPNVI